MKLKILALVLSLIVFLWLFAGCTPKAQKPNDNNLLPDLETRSDNLTETESEQATPTQPDAEAVSSVTEGENPDQTDSIEPSSEGQPVESELPVAETEDELDAEIEDEIVITVDDGLGVGGN